VEAEEKKLYVKLAYGYYQNGEYKKAMSLYERLWSADSEDFNISNMLGDSYLKAGMQEKAAEAYLNTMNLYEKKGQTQKLIRLAKKTRRYFPEDSRIKTKITTVVRMLVRDAERKVMQKEYDEAREIYEGIEEFDSGEFPVKANLKELNEEEVKHKQREASLAQTKAQKPESAGDGLIDKFDKMAQNYLNNGDFDGAVETYITALKLSPNNEELREKLHDVYRIISQKSLGSRVWDKINASPKDKIEEAKQKALEESRQKILVEEEKRARLLMEEEEKIQQEYEKAEAEIIQKAARELKQKLDEAQKKEKLKEEEIQRIMREQEAKKRELLEKIKREAVEKWKKQKTAIQGEEEGSTVPEPAPQPAAEPFKIQFKPQAEKKQESIFDHLKKAYESPRIGEGKNIASAPVIKQEKKDDGMIDDTGEVEAKPVEEDIIVNDDTLDSLITTAYIYINQGMIKDALRIYNKTSEKYPAHPEIKTILKEIEKKQAL